jgi:hypothetical protein
MGEIIAAQPRISVDLFAFRKKMWWAYLQVDEAWLFHHNVSARTIENPVLWRFGDFAILHD